MMKMDFLRLGNLSIIKNTIKIITARAKKHNKPIDPLISDYFDSYEFHPPINDTLTFETIFQT